MPEDSEAFLRKARREAATGVSRLSPMERSVFHLLGHGVPTRQIAERLGRSVKTIEAHRAEIKKRLGCANAVQLVARAAAWVALGGHLEDASPSR